MKTIGLTGGIASGKSTVSCYLGSKGIPIIDADAIAVRLAEPEGLLWLAYVRHFGKRVLRLDGTLDRRIVGKIIFHDNRERIWLDRTAHPLIRQEVLRERERHRQTGAKAVVFDVPLLFEAGWDALADETWVVWLRPENQLSRLMARNGYDAEQARLRIAAQMSLVEKCRRADVVLDNNGSREELWQQVDSAWASFCCERI
jgi:dephospho-CoA kinase